MADEALLAEVADHPVGQILRARAVVCLNTNDRSLFANAWSAVFAA